MIFERIRQPSSRKSQSKTYAARLELGEGSEAPNGERILHSDHRFASIPIEPSAPQGSTPIQTKSITSEQSAGLTRTTEQQPNNTGLPDQLKAGIEHLSGFSLDNVTVHYDSDRPARFRALAFTQGTDIHIGPGQERHLPHEAWHVVQQARGRVKPTLRMKGGVSVNDDTGLEHEADVMGARASVIGLPTGYRDAFARRLVVPSRLNSWPDRLEIAGNVVQRVEFTKGEIEALEKSKKGAAARIETDRTKAIERFKQLGLIPKYKEDLVDAAAALLNKSKLTINFKADKLGLLAQSNRVKTAWEVGSSDERDPTPGHYGYKREVAETQILGYAPHSSETISDLKAGQRYGGEKERIGRPKYAAVNFTNAHYGAASKYGAYHFILKDEVKNRATFTGADTFRNVDDEGKPKEEGRNLKDLSELVGTSENMYAVLATGRPEVVQRIGEMAALGNFMERGEHHPSLAEVNETVYAEAQIQGSLGWEDVEAIGVPAAELIELDIDEKALKKLNKVLKKESKTMQDVVWSTGQDNKSMNFLLGNPKLKSGMINALSKYGVNDIQHEFRPPMTKQPRSVPFNLVLKVSVNEPQLTAVLNVAKEKKVGIRVVGTPDTFGTWDMIADEVKKIAKKKKVQLSV